MENEIRDGNRLIAEFMGWTIEPGMEKEPNPYYNHGFNMLMPSQMGFASSWDWLMPVVIKVKDFLNNMERPSKNHVCKGDVLEVDVTCALQDANIGKLWEALIPLIQWINDYKPTTTNHEQ